MKARARVRVSAVLGGLIAGMSVMATPPAQAAPSLIVLTVDTEYLESTMPLYATLAADAEGAQVGADAVRRSDIDLARELRRSEVLIALPEAIAEVARAANADLVIDRALARHLTQTAPDITSEVERILVAQFAQLPLEPGP